MSQRLVLHRPAGWDLLLLGQRAEELQTTVSPRLLVWGWGVGT